MTPREALVESLKRRLRARGISYATLASLIPCSEASVKRMFAGRNFDLRRLDRILEVLDDDLSDLVRDAGMSRAELQSLTHEQEAAIVADPVLFTVAVCALHQLELEQITASTESVRRQRYAVCFSSTGWAFLHFIRTTTTGCGSVEPSGG